ncbi:NADH dehydrogenase [ubiquinone] 1 beta subcomplex subunit 8, mitochondrial-like [Watersipora subatra]|uniref:NADH dehydrogenase [ubiquinone] 1 beta subcomplex subunit 8, mitochondrial-like n=1 Tax=Watersipora subatra TaxID=2589382 RepID=UPI00355ACE9B
MAALSSGRWFSKCRHKALILALRLGQSSRLITSTARSSAVWNRDWVPGPYPKTQAERAAAAEKYGLRVEDYQPYNPDEDPGYGDYPKVKWIGAEARDPYDDIDYPHTGTNYKEVLHVRADQSVSDRYNPSWEDQSYFSTRFMLTVFLSIYFGGMALQALCEYFDIRTHMPAMPKQYPDHLWVQRGKDREKMPTVTHYTFEPDS